VYVLEGGILIPKRIESFPIVYNGSVHTLWHT
jgi:hypothetical protein